MAYGIHWFRRDLRVAGNPALSQNWRTTGGKVVGLFVFDPQFLARPDFSPNRFAFFLETLRELREELRRLGSDLLVMDSGYAEAFAQLFAALKARPSVFSYNRDYEPFARARDTAAKAWLRKQGTEVLTDRDHLLIEPDELFKPTDPSATYQVFTPFSKQWYALFATPEVQARLEPQRRGIAYLDQGDRAEKSFSLRWDQILSPPFPTGTLEIYLEKNRPHVTVTLPPAGSRAALRVVRAFKKRVGDYEATRDFPGVPGTSGFSPYFKNGSLTVAQVIAELDLRPGKFLNELVWREFYYHILFHHPRVEHEAFLEKFSTLPWPNDETWFTAWKAGQTGFPIVDAGMRQLKHTGWMHNRVRMIVASFLTKDLLVDWKWGERYFMEQLLDGDLAPNNGGWQWAASTGCDPQPYFRIFNPWLQGKKFDPDGTYIKKWVPELVGVPAAELHEPPERLRNGYPVPLVDHAVQRDKALALYKG